MEMRYRNSLVFLVFGISGYSALVYEVAWTRSLSLVLGSTTFAVSTMLTAFLAGIAVGAWGGGRVADRTADRPGRLLLLLGLAQLGIGVFSLLAMPLINAMAMLYVSAFKTLHSSLLMLAMVQAIVSIVVMLPSTVLMGATFPFVSRIVTPGLESMGRKVGIAYFYNTAGAVLGSLSAGFLLIPGWGVRSAVFFAAALNVLSACMVFIYLKARANPDEVPDTSAGMDTSAGTGSQG